MPPAFANSSSNPNPAYMQDTSRTGWSRDMYPDKCRVERVDWRHLCILGCSKSVYTIPTLASEVVDLPQRHNAIISGSFVVYLLFGPVSWKPKDIDIYAPHALWKGLIASLEAIGFEEKNTTMDNDYKGDKLPGITGLKHMTRDGLQFDVIQSAEAAADFPIPHFHSTLVMNFLAHDHLSIAYPLLTLHGLAIQNPSYSLSRGIRAGAQVKYDTRGFTLQAFRQRDHAEAAGYTTSIFPCSASLCPQQERSFYDNRSLVVPWSSNSFRNPKYSTLWIAGGAGCGQEGCTGDFDGWADVGQSDEEYCIFSTIFPKST